jgi:type IV pilus assembly protein PilP
MKRNCMTRARLLAQYVFLSVALVSCGFSTTDELNAWLANERKLHAAASLPITAPRVFEAEAYELAGQIDPFSSNRLPGDHGASSIAPSPVKKDATYDLELAGERRDLEKVSLDAVEFKGTLSQNGAPVALVWANRQLHQVKLGDYLGQNRGKVMQISAQEILLRELLQDGSGQWAPKTTVLALSRGGK